MDASNHNNIAANFIHFPNYTEWCSREGNQQSTLEQYHDELYTHGLHLSKDNKGPEDAFAVFEYLANNGHAGGMNAYGISIIEGDTPDGFRDPSEGYAWVEKSAKLGCPKGQRNLSAYLSEGIVCKQNGVEALRWGYAAIEQGHVEAYNPIGCMYMNGQGVPRDLVKAAEVFQRGVDAGSVDCISRLGLLYQQGRGVSKDVPKAMELFEKATGLGDMMGCYYLGCQYAEGDDGIQKDLCQAFKYYERAAQANVVSAIRNVGHCYENGNGVPQSYEISLQYYTRAAKYDDSWTLYHLGSIYQHGTGVQQDYAKAREYLERAAKQKHKEAICALGFLLSEGLGSTKDPVRAAELYQQSAALGDGIGAYNSGVVFENGQGVPADLLIALDYYKQAVRLKCDLARPLLQPTSYLMTLLHSVGTMCLMGDRGKEAKDHFQAAAQLGHDKSIAELSKMYADALWGNDAVTFDTDMRYFTPPEIPDTTLSILPVELITHIFQFLHPKQCIQLRSITHRMLTLIDNDSFARHLFQFNALLLPSRGERSVHWFDKMLFRGPHAFQVAFVETGLNGIREIGSHELKYVSQTDHKFSEFPAAFLQWTSLTSLQLSGVQLTGAIPESIKYLRSLKEVNLSRNRFDGTEIPSASIMHLDSLEVLLLNACGLIGEVGLEFAAFLKTLKWYSLRKNKLKFAGSTKFKWVGRKSLDKAQVR
ncbi:hypothetical protein BJ741DRAFT_307350 [Chytriomyces cf. hyalinus JEL632]|nr:hypothetical protein BJ741DRAFT_307350 [Chytriomyces cf. hyalinus JEL632]